jgi:Anti-sigma factor NepR
MGASKPPRHDAPTIISGDWSTGFNATSSSSLSDAKLLGHIGSRLREYYKHLADEPLPESLVEIVDRFESRRRRHVRGENACGND